MNQKFVRAGATLIFSTIAGTLLCGCIHHPYHKSSARADALPAAATAAKQRAPDVPTILKSSEPKIKGSYAVRTLSLSPRLKDGNEALVTYFTPHPARPITPGIVVLPIMGGKQYVLENYFAAGFARNGYSVAVVHRPEIKDEIRSLEDIDPLLQGSIEDARRVVDWLEAQPGIDRERLGLFGISLGAIRGVMVLASEPRLKVGVLGLPGGDLPYILTRSQDKNLVKYRKKLLEKNGLTIEEGEQRLREAISWDPMAAAEAIDPSRVLMVIAAFDKVVPVSKGWELRRKMRNPETIEVCGGHYSSVVHLPYLRAMSSKFFARKFAADTPGELASVSLRDRLYPPRELPWD